MKNNLFEQLESFGKIPSGLDKMKLKKICDVWFDNGHYTIISVKYAEEMFWSQVGAIPLDNITVETNVKTIKFNQRDLNRRFS